MNILKILTISKFDEKTIDNIFDATPGKGLVVFASYNQAWIDAMMMPLGDIYAKVGKKVNIFESIRDTEMAKNVIEMAKESVVISAIHVPPEGVVKRFKEMFANANLPTESIDSVSIIILGEGE